MTEPEPKAVAAGPSANGANPLVPAKPTANELRDRLDEARAREREWASGVCPDSGKAVHACHRSVCDCFGAEDCASCGGTR